jgi:thiopurine S-methyltransferase
MDTEYWLKRWRESRIGWHHDKPMPLLERHWPRLELRRGTRVLVPLAGKSVDMVWLAGHGMHVLAVEVSPLAVESFLAENRLDARNWTDPEGVHYAVTNPPEGGAIEIINGDLFKTAPATIATCTALYDRAASIALPAATRERLVHDVYAKLPEGSRGLLITLDYPPQQMDGPPFSVDEDEVNRLFATDWNIEQVERRDILHSQPSFSEQGVTSLHTTVHTLARRTTT